MCEPVLPIVCGFLDPFLCESFWCIIVFYGYTNGMQWTTKAIIKLNLIELNAGFGNRAEEEERENSASIYTRFTDILWNIRPAKKKKMKIICSVFFFLFPSISTRSCYRY